MARLLSLRSPPLRSLILVGAAASLGAAFACSASGGAPDGPGEGGPGATAAGGTGAYIPYLGQGANVQILTDTEFEETVVATPVCIPEPFPRVYTCQGEPGPWSEALQKVLWFFNVNRSGPGVHRTDVQWRGDAHTADGHIRLDPADPTGVNLPAELIEAHRDVLDPDGNGEVDLAGGYHDAGDYIKFTLTTAYAASMIAWSLYEYPDAFATTGLTDEALG